MMTECKTSEAGWPLHAAMSKIIIITGGRMPKNCGSAVLWVACPVLLWAPGTRLQTVPSGTDPAARALYTRHQSVPGPDSRRRKWRCEQELPSVRAGRVIRLLELNKKYFWNTSHCAWQSELNTQMAVEG